MPGIDIANVVNSDYAMDKICQKLVQWLLGSMQKMRGQVVELSGALDDLQEEFTELQENAVEH